MHGLVINNRDITILITFRENTKHLTKSWAKVLKINKNRIITKRSDRGKEETCNIQVNGIVFRRLVEVIIKKILQSNFLDNRKFRRAFLRGLFAAEGNIWIAYKEKKPYINQVTYSLSIKEENLKNLICYALDVEGIRYRVKRRVKDNSLSITISNWKNYLRLWSICTFSLCERKDNQFKMIAKKLDIYLKFNPVFRNKFFTSLNMCQRNIAGKICSWQANVCRTMSGMHLLRIEQIIKLLSYSRYSMNEVIKNAEYARIGSLTKLKIDEDVINFLKEFKSL